MNNVDSHSTLQRIQTWALSRQASIIFGLIVSLYQVPYQAIVPTISNAYVALLAFQFGCVTLAVYLVLELLKRPQPSNSAIKVFLISLLVLCYWIPLGFDITDEGRRLSFSWFLIDDPNGVSVDSKFGSHFLLYLWLKLLPGPSVLWARLGYAIVKSLTVLLIFNICKTLATPRSAVVASLLSLPLILVMGGQVINYNNVPVLMATGAIFLLLFPNPWNAKKKRWTQLLAGCLLTFTVISKFTMLPILALPLALFFSTKSTKADTFRNVSWVMGGILLSAAGFLLILHFSDLLSTFIEHIRKAYIDGFFSDGKQSQLKMHRHDRETILNIYSQQSLRLLHLLMFILPVLLMSLTFLHQKLHRLWLGAPLVIIVLSVWMFGYETHSYVIIALCIALWPIGFVAPQVREHRAALTMAVFLALASFIGSNNGLRTMLYSGAIALPTSILFSLFMTGERPQWINPLALKKSTVALAMAFAMILLHLKGDNIYRDVQRNAIDTPFQTAALAGIFSNAERVESLDGVLENIKSGQSKSLLAVNTIPGMHYLTNVPWNVWGKYWKMNAEREQSFNESTAPELIVINLKNSRQDAWPSTDQVSIKKDLPYVQFYMDMLPRSTYKKTYANEVFEVWSRPKGKQLLTRLAEKRLETSDNHDDRQ